MARKGAFDATLEPRAWFDGKALPEGWFANELIPAPSGGDITGTASGTISFTGASTGTVVTQGAWEVAGASYGGVSFNVSGQDPSPNDVTFSADGTNMYIIGAASDTAFQYSLSTAWDVGTASYGGISFSVGSQEGTPAGLHFSADGTKMYVVGPIATTVFQYTLSTAWNLGTASYSGTSFSVGSQETFPTDLTFSVDGTKMYVVGSTADAVFQYSLSTAWDVGSASYSSLSFSVSGQEVTPHGVAFSVDGTKMYVVGTVSDRVFQYILSTAWDVGTASYGSLSFSVAAQETTPSGLAFKPDGSRMYVVGFTSDAVFQYDLSSGTSSIGTASGTLGFTGAATGTVAVSGPASGTLPLGGAATGVIGNVPITGTASGTLALTGSSTGVAPIAGVISGTFGLAGSSTGVVVIAATSSGTLPITGVSTGTVTVAGSITGTASGTIAFTGTSLGSVTIAGTGSGAISLTGTSAGVVRVAGTGNGTLQFTGSSTGLVAVAGSINGAVSGVISLSGSSVGIISATTLGGIPIAEAIEIIFNSEIAPGLTLRQAVLDARKTSKLALALSL